MPATSKKQQQFMGMVHSYQKGDMKDAPASVKKAAKTISKKAAEDFAGTKHGDIKEHMSLKEFISENMTGGQKAAYDMGKKHGLSNSKKIDAEKSFGTFASYYHKGYKDGVSERDDSDAWHEKQQSGRRSSYHESQAFTAESTNEYKVGDKVETHVGGKWLPAIITKPPHKITGNYGVQFTHNKKTHNTVSSLEQLRRPTNESTQPVLTSLLQELHLIEKKTTKKKKVPKTVAAKVYHRDYERTKNKPYRQYDPEENESKNS